MATILIADSNGRRRVAVEAAAIGHKTYSAGTLSEAIRLLDIYVPEFIILSGGPDDPLATELVERLKTDDASRLSNFQIVVADSTPEFAGIRVIPSRPDPAHLILTVTEFVNAERPILNLPTQTPEHPTSEDPSSE